MYVQMYICAYTIMLMVGQREWQDGVERPTRNAAVSRLWKKGDGALQLGLPHSCRETGVAAGKQGWLSKLSLMGSTGLLQTIIPPLLVHLKLSFHSYPFSSFLLIVLKLYFTFTGCPETTLPLLLVVLNLFVYFYWSPWNYPSNFAARIQTVFRKCTGRKAIKRLSCPLYQTNCLN